MKTGDQSDNSLSSSSSPLASIQLVLDQPPQLSPPSLTSPPALSVRPDLVLAWTRFPWNPTRGVLVLVFLLLSNLRWLSRKPEIHKSSNKDAVLTVWIKRSVNLCQPGGARNSLSDSLCTCRCSISHDCCVQPLTRCCCCCCCRNDRSKNTFCSFQEASDRRRLHTQQQQQRLHTG